MRKGVTHAHIGKVLTYSFYTVGSLHIVTVQGEVMRVRVRMLRVLCDVTFSPFITCVHFPCVTYGCFQCFVTSLTHCLSLAFVSFVFVSCSRIKGRLPLVHIIR